VFVRKDAQHTNAQQDNRNLLLSDGATVHTKPHLEIEADDVTCSHGATIGALDPDQLFYLRARGIANATAAAMLTIGFVRELIKDVSRADVRTEILQEVRKRCPDGGSVIDVSEDLS
jgi:Fe-S cluster assembly protein SufD